MDEIFIKSDLVYDKHDASLIGFENIWNTNNQILEFEAMIESGGAANPSLASTMMMFMVRGLLVLLSLCSVCLWERNEWRFNFWPYLGSSGSIRKNGIFFVLALCCNGASSNHKLWKLHSKDNELLYRVPNFYAAEGQRFLYFISDPPHLLKTIWNSWYNEKRRLWVNSILQVLANTMIFIPSVMVNGLSGSTW